MQRVLSLQTSRCTDTSGEFVSKRLCASFLFSVAFFAILGGYLLGRYATDRAILLKTKTILQDVHSEEQMSLQSVRDLAEAINNIYNMTKVFSQAEENPEEVYEGLYERFQCNFSSVGMPTKTEFQKNIALESSKIVSYQLKSLERCYEEVGELLKQYISNFKR